MRSTPKFCGCLGVDSQHGDLAKWNQPKTRLLKALMVLFCETKSITTYLKRTSLDKKSGSKAYRLHRGRKGYMTLGFQIPSKKGFLPQLQTENPKCPEHQGSTAAESNRGTERRKGWTEVGLRLSSRCKKAFTFQTSINLRALEVDKNQQDALFKMC